MYSHCRRAGRMIYRLAICLSLLSIASPVLAALPATAGVLATSPETPGPAVDLAPQARSAILIDAITGTVLYEKRPHQRLPIASVTKIPTMLLAFEAIDRGQVRLTDRVKTSEYAASMGGSQIFLQPGEEMSLSDMLKGVAIASANDAAVAVAEHLAGSEAAFVNLMNQRARELGLRDSHFVNSNGLPAPNHYSSAYDIAEFSRELMKHEGVTKFTGIYSDYLRKGSDRPFWLVNTNKLVRFYTGMDGIKTGFTSESGYCLSATAKRGQFRPIAVVLGAPTAKVRNAEITAMMNYAFAHYDTRLLYVRGQTVTLAPVSRGRLEAVGVTPVAPVGVLVDKLRHTTTGRVITEISPLRAPVKKGQVAGYAQVMEGGRTVVRVPLVAVADVPKISLFEMMGRTLRRVLVLGATR